MSFQTLKYGSRSDFVKALQFILGIKADGIFGNDTEQAVLDYQEKHGLEVDGKAGKNTIKKILENAPVLSFGSTGAFVYALETILETMKLDGIYTQDEIAHVKTFQASKNLVQDGIVGKKTWAALFGVDEEQNGGSAVVDNWASTKQPINFKQYDSRWGSITYTKNGTYNKKQTIRNSGCGPTSMADILATWFDKNITPKETCAMSVANGFRTTSSGTSWAFYKFIAGKYPFSKFIQTSSFVTMQNCLAAGGLVVVSFKKSKWTNGG